MAERYMGINIQRDDLVYPYFVTGGKDRKEAIKSFPGQFRFSLDRLLDDIEKLDRLGIDKILIFGIPKDKDWRGSSAYAKNNVVSAAVEGVKKHFSHLTVMTDVCLCAYTEHGHCGIVRGSTRFARDFAGSGVQGSGQFIDNRKTLEALAKIALSHAEAGADYVAPSAMAKRQVAAIRKHLDKNGFKNTKIMGYSAKFASNFYGPFRNAAGSSPKFSDRSSYQLNYSDAGRALIEIAEDIKEGADIVMVKPALAYLDIIKEAKSKFRIPLAAYNVSGEYSFVKYGAKANLWDEKNMVFEIITSIKRAGADLIITYHAKDIARWLKG